MGSLFAGGEREKAALGQSIAPEDLFDGDGRVALFNEGSIGAFDGSRQYLRLMF